MAEASAVPSGKKKREKKPVKYKNPKKMKKPVDKIQSGMRGFLVFGADRENAARREAYNLLNEYADELFGSEFMESIFHRDVPHKLIVDYQHGRDKAVVDYEVESQISDVSGISDDDVDDDEEKEKEEEDIGKTIAKEISLIKEAEKDRRFQCITTGVHAIVFIRSSLSREHIDKLAHFILSDLEQRKLNKARSFSRLVPITHICRADIDSVRKVVTEHFLPELNGDEDDNVPKRFCVQFKARFNNTLTRNQAINEIAATLIKSGHLVDLTSPDMIIIVEVMKSVCCMNMVRDFFRFKKYNIHEITSTKENTDNVQSRAKTTKKTKEKMTNEQEMKINPEFKREEKTSAEQEAKGEPTICTFVEN